MAANVCEPIIQNWGQLGPNSYIFPNGGIAGGFGEHWLALSMAALAASLFILVMVYLFATFLRHQGLLTWAKFELYQIFGTAVIVLFMVCAIVFGTCNFDMGFLGDDKSFNGNNPYRQVDPGTGQPVIDPATKLPVGMNMYQIIDKYFTDVEELGYILFAYLMYMVKIINFTAKAMWTSNPIGVGSTDSPLESLAQVNSLFFLMVSGFITSFLLLQFQMRMLEYLAVACLYYLFPFGIFFRAFEPTRGFGGTLIGLAISLLLFYPIIMVFNDYLIERTGVVSGAKAELESAVAGAQQQAKDKTALPSGAQAAAQNTTQIQDAGMETPDKPGSISNAMAGSMMFLFKPIMLYFLAAVILPVINFIVLVEITRGITHFFGEEIDVTNLTRLI